jgi:hypothetical protein
VFFVRVQASVLAAADALSHKWKASQGKLPEVGHKSDAAVLLASKGLARWLDDEAFVAALIDPLKGDVGSNFHLLSACVDAIPASKADPSREGIALVACSLSGALPDLWDQGIRSAQTTDQPALILSMRPFASSESSGGVGVTVPLANTVFENGRSHTMTASRWERADGATPQRLLERRELGRQDVLLPQVQGSMSMLDVPLVPVTEARKIVAGLGNILRQVEIDGKPVPASKELEAIIPKLLEARSLAQKDAAAASRIGVWALVLPGRRPDNTSSLEPTFMDPLEAGAFGDVDAEWDMTAEVAEPLTQSLGNGAQIRKICKSRRFLRETMPMFTRLHRY